MNHYGEMARSHWARWLPARYSQIQDPDSYFAALGLEVARRVGDLMLDLAGQDPPGEDYLAKVARLNAARRQAEEIVLAEEVLLDPEPEASPAEEENPSAPQPVPAVVERGHPLWEQVNAEQMERLQDS